MAKEEAELLNIPMENLFSKLATSKEGLSSQEAEDRLVQYGPNELAHKKERVKILQFVARFKNPLIVILLFAAVLSGILGDLASMSIIITIITISVILDFYQESRAEQAAKLLQEKVSVTASVFRDGAKRDLKMSEIVPGDVIELSAGDVVPADARVLIAKDLFVDQSALTGESFPVEKSASLPTVKNLILTEWPNGVFMGTPVVSGNGIAVVLKSGGNTEYGKIAKRLVGREQDTEFERATKKFGLLILEVTLLLVLFVFFVLSLLKENELESFLFALALAVGLTPDLLPVIISINLSRGALAMSKKGVIVKRLASIQNFGNMDVLCTDKTGTLTENKITLMLHINLFGKDDDEVLRFSFINSYFQTGLKGALDEAILAFKTIDISDIQKVDEIPFDFIRKRVSIAVRQEEHHCIITKGAPEEILKVCSSYKLNGEVSDLTPEFQAKIVQKYIELSGDGYRVLSVCYKEVSSTHPLQYEIHDEVNMTFSGFVAFIDPPKATAKESLQLLRQAGIEVKVITGDNDLVARKTCEQLGFPIRGVTLGSELPQLDDYALARVVENTNIFARVTPVQKSRILHILKSNGHVVGYMGDGINDAPSIKAADVGISVDNAVDVAKEAADIILVEKKLRVLYDGVIEGRKTFTNTLKYILMSTSSNFGNMFSVAIAAIFLPFLPMSPTQILLNNLLYDLSESTIPTDNVDESALKRPTRIDISYIRKFMLLMGSVSSLFDILTFIVMIGVFNANEHLFQTGWFVESLCTQTLVIFALRTRVSPFFKSKPSKALLWSSIGIAGLAIAIPFTFLGPLFHFATLPLDYFLFLVVVIGTYFVLVEIVKAKFDKKYGFLLQRDYLHATPLSA